MHESSRNGRVATVKLIVSSGLNFVLNYITHDPQFLTVVSTFRPSRVPHVATSEIVPKIQRLLTVK